VGEVFRILDQRPVPWVLLENVSFMLRLERGRAMDALAQAFEHRGYRWAYRVTNSLSFVPQRRERVLFLATRTEIDPASVLLTDEVEPQLSPTDLDARAHGFYWTEGLRGLGWAPDAVPTLKNGSTVGIASPPAILLPDGSVITPDIRDAERLQGFPEDWTRPAETVAKPSLRWSLVGNAVTVPLANWLGHKLNRPGEFEVSRDSDFARQGRWPRAARFDGSKRHAVEISAFPEWRDRPPLVAFLRYPGKPLSARATRGFLSRTYRAKLRFPEGFQDRLREHLFIMEGQGRSNHEFAIAAE
jgi:DNA (cytosine-5)-methyltransferase 1